MLVNTKCFGEIELDEEKIIQFEKGIMGFEEEKKWTILYDLESKDNTSISWLQSLDEPMLAIPVVNPHSIVNDYNPTIEDEVLKPLGDLTDENLVVLLALTVPDDVKKTTANLKAPFIINADTKKGIQLVVENDGYPVKFNVYESVQHMKTGKEAD